MSFYMVAMVMFYYLLQFTRYSQQQQQKQNIDLDLDL